MLTPNFQTLADSINKQTKSIDSLINIISVNQKVKLPKPGVVTGVDAIAQRNQQKEVVKAFKDTELIKNKMSIKMWTTKWSKKFLDVYKSFLNLKVVRVFTDAFSRVTSFIEGELNEVLGELSVVVDLGKSLFKSAWEAAKGVGEMMWKTLSFIKNSVFLVKDRFEMKKFKEDRKQTSLLRNIRDSISTAFQSNTILNNRLFRMARFGRDRDGKKEGGILDIIPGWLKLLGVGLGAFGLWKMLPNSIRDSISAGFGFVGDKIQSTLSSELSEMFNSFKASHPLLSKLLSPAMVSGGARMILKRVPIVGGIYSFLSTFAETGSFSQAFGAAIGNLGGAAAGAAAGGTMGSMILPGIGTAIGTAIGAVGGSAIAEKFGSWIMKSKPSEALGKTSGKGSYQDFYNVLMGIESRGKNVKTNVPGGTASGFWQITNDTWARYGGVELSGVTSAMMATPEQQNVIMQKITDDNKKELLKRGLPVRYDTMYLCHILGWPTATRILQDNKNQAIEAFLTPKAISGNKRFTQGGGITTGQLIKNIQKGTGTAEIKGAGDAMSMSARYGQSVRDSKNPADLKSPFRERVFGAINEFKAKYGRAPVITSVNRSIATQSSLYNQMLSGGTRYPVATPGNSYHNYGMAIDFAPNDAAKLESSGILARNGLWRPVNNDPVHVQLFGTRGALGSTGAGGTGAGGTGEVFSFLKYFGMESPTFEGANPFMGDAISRSDLSIKKSTSKVGTLLNQEKTLEINSSLMNRPIVNVESNRNKGNGSSINMNTSNSVANSSDGGGSKQDIPTSLFDMMGPLYLALNMN